MNQWIEWLTQPEGWVTRIAIAAGIFLGGWLLARIAGALITRSIRSGRIDETLALFISSLARAFIIVAAAIAALGHLGVETTSLVAILATAGLAVGLALKDSLSSFAAGAMLMTFRPFRAGDYVEAGGTAGIVERVGMFHTRMKTPDNREVTLPNAMIANNLIVNYSARDTRRIDIRVGIGYDDRAEDARRVILDIIAADDRFLDDPEPVIWIDGFGDSSVDLVIKVWTLSEHYWQARSDLFETIHTEFANAGITIPYPHQVQKVQVLRSKSRNGNE